MNQIRSPEKKFAHHCSITTKMSSFPPDVEADSKAPNASNTVASVDAVL